MYFGGFAAQDAWQEMKDYGYKDSWTLLGLKKYLNKHPKPPASSPQPVTPAPLRHRYLMGKFHGSRLADPAPQPCNRKMVP
jgi:hypothetical protein